jgi:hypothetical protein
MTTQAKTGLQKIDKITLNDKTTHDTSKHNSCQNPLGDTFVAINWLLAGFFTVVSGFLQQTRHIFWQYSPLFLKNNAINRSCSTKRGVFVDHTFNNYTNTCSYPQDSGIHINFVGFFVVMSVE